MKYSEACDFILEYVKAKFDADNFLIEKTRTDVRNRTQTWSYNINFYRIFVIKDGLVIAMSSNEVEGNRKNSFGTKKYASMVISLIPVEPAIDHTTKSKFRPCLEYLEELEKQVAPDL